MTIASAGDAALLLAAGSDDLQGGNEAASIAAAIRAAALPGVIDIVPGAQTVLVTFAPGSWAAPELAGRLRQLAGDPAVLAAVPPPEPVVIDTVYDGPDLADVAALTGLTGAEVIARHEAAEYQVGWMGFAPGFGYLTGLDPALAVPRLASPRQLVPAGSVAIAGGLAAVYPSASPGGWRLIGRTGAVLWDTRRDPPALLAAGQRVRFRAVDRLPESAPPLFTDLVRANPNKTPADMHEIREESEIRAGERWIEVLQPGPLTTIQDLGRPGLAHLGVPHSGAADAASFRRANRLAGNDDNDAGLEVTLGRLALRFGCDAVVALAGAPVPVRLNAGPGSSGTGAPSGQPTGARSPDGSAPAAVFAADSVSAAGSVSAADSGFAAESAFAVPAGAVLRLGAPPAGLRTYLAISGGIQVTPVLGSRSADVLSGLGPQPLRPGGRLRVGRPRSRPGDPSGELPRTACPGPREVARLRVIAGPRDDWFAPAALTALGTGTFQVTAASNRTGLRLAGPALHRSREAELPSEGVAAGSLQVTHDGQPILLLADRPVTGGYPVIGVVAADDLGLAAQLRPGQRIRFAVSPGYPASSR